MTGFSPDVKAVIRDRAQNLCERCGQYASDCVAHHRRPRGMGGSSRGDTNRPSNALWLCGMCHNVVEHHREQALLLGQLLRQSQSPADERVLRRGAWVFLGDNGDVIPASQVDEDDDQRLGWRTI